MIREQDATDRGTFTGAQKVLAGLVAVVAIVVPILGLIVQLSSS